MRFERGDEVIRNRMHLAAHAASSRLLMSITNR
jgi:hypothetical protein